MCMKMWYNIGNNFLMIGAILMMNMFNVRFLMVVILVFCAIVALIAVIAILCAGRKKKQNTTVPLDASAAEPLPGGGGSYTMRISGMNCEHCRANAEAALNAFDGVQAQVDLKTETAHIKYTGYPDLELLDRLRKAVEDAGFSVTEIQ